MQKNILHNCDFLANDLPDGCADLIIADPPYFEVKGDFDYIWSSFEDYLEDVKKWAAECKRLLADNGTLIWYGDDKNIAYSQIILDTFFRLLNNAVWEKAEKDGLFGTTGNKTLRSFPTSTERLLIYDKGEDKTGLEMIFANPNLFKNIKNYLDKELEKTGLTLREACIKYGSTCSHYFGFSKREKTQFSLPTAEKYELLQSSGYFKRPYEELRKEYEELRKEYEELRRYWNNITRSTEVLKFRFEPSQYQHPTIKPETLTRALIETTTRKEATIIVPFAGSGTECAVALKEGRSFIGYEIDPNHYSTALKRIEHAKQQPLKLF